MRPRLPFEVRQEHDGWGNAPHLLAPEDHARIEEGTWRRASGLCVCGTCGGFYYDHPEVLGALWLHRICNDFLVKL